MFLKSFYAGFSATGKRQRNIAPAKQLARIAWAVLTKANRAVLEQRHDEIYPERDTSPKKRGPSDRSGTNSRS